MDWLLFAQNGVEILPQSPAGWAGWGLFFLNGGVLVWFLIKYLPDSNARFERLMNAKDAEARRVADAAILRFDAMLELFRIEGRETRVEFSKTVAVITNTWKEETSRIIEALRAELRAMQDNRSKPRAQ